MSPASPEDTISEPRMPTPPTSAARSGPPPVVPERFAWPPGGGEAGARLREFDWQASPLGPPAGWPAALRNTLRTVLNLAQPALLYWGAQPLCFCNDASRPFLGAQLHAAMLGVPAQPAWGDAWPDSAAHVARAAAGADAHWTQARPAAYDGAQARQPAHTGTQARPAAFTEDAAATLATACWTCHASPVEQAGAPGGVGGVLVLCSALAPARSASPSAAEPHWRALLACHTGLVCVLSGPQHRIAQINPRGLALTAGRAVVGKPLIDCLPELAGHGVIERLDQVYRSGVAHADSAIAWRVPGDAGSDGPTHYFDCACRPIRDDHGPVTGLCIEAHDVTERTLATQALNDTLESIADGFAAFDSDGRLNHLNAAGARLLGADAAQWQGRVFNEVFSPPDTADGGPGPWLATSGRVCEFEQFDAATGQCFDVRCYRRRGGGMAVYFQDRTARKRAELAHEAAEQRERERAQELETLMRNVPALIWIAHDPGCDRITGNPESARLTRMDLQANASASAAESMRNRPFREYIHGRPADPNELPLQRAVREDIVISQAELSFVFDDGSVRHLYGGAAPLYDRHGAVRGAVSAFVDITDFKATQSKLELRERELRTLADNTPDILSRFDRQHRHTFVNAAIERATGRAPPDYIGRTHREMGMPADLASRWDAAIQRVFDTGRACRIEFSLPVRGALRTYVTRLLPEAGPDGHVGQVLSIAQDVTEQRQAEMAVRVSERRKDEFLATLAHELRNPLAPLRTGVHILERDPDVPTAAAVRVMMNRQLSTMVRLIDELLDVSRISAGKMTLQPERVSLQDVAEMAIESSRPALQAGSHELSVDMADEPVCVQADPMRLAQVIGNLLANAAKYTPPGGRIALKVGREGSAGAMAVLSVSDNGLGIPPHMLRDVFEMFTQVNRKLKRAQGGLGVGLALARTIVGLHEGTVEAHSGGLGEGSVFTVRLPALPLEPKRAEATGPDVAVDTAIDHLHILVVDDNRDAADSLAMLLQLSGHEVRAAYDGVSALKAVGEAVPDVAFLDISMPGMNGFDLARALLERVAPTPVYLVALTGHGTPLDAWRTREAGFAVHLTKPVSLEAVEEVLQTVREGRPTA